MSSKPNMSQYLLSLLDKIYLFPKDNYRSKKDFLRKSVDSLFNEINEQINYGGSRQYISRMAFEILISRERLSSTGMGNGIAIPHAKCSFLSEVVIGIFVAEPAIDWDAIDRKPVNIFVVCFIPDYYVDGDDEVLRNEVLKILAAMAELLSFKTKLWDKFTESVTSIEMKSCLTTIIHSLPNEYPYSGP